MLYAALKVLLTAVLVVAISEAAKRSIADRWASMPRPERCWRCVETLRYAIARSMSKVHTTVCDLVVAQTRAT